MAVDARAGEAREKARQEKNRYKRRALDAEAQVVRLEEKLAALEHLRQGYRTVASTPLRIFLDVFDRILQGGE